MPNIFPEAIYQYHPKWLGRQSLDVYIPSVRIGFEYQGIQHYKAIDFFGGEDNYTKRVELDSKKKKLCEKNNVTLIEIRYDENVSVKAIKKLLDRYGIDLSL